MIAHYFPNGMEPYLIGGALIGAGVALLFLVTGRLGGVSTFFSAAWSFCLKSPFFRQPMTGWKMCARNWKNRCTTWA